MAISDLVIKFGATGSPQTLTIAEQIYSTMPVGHGSVTQDRWRCNSVTVNGIVFTVFPGISSDGSADVWINAAYAEAPGYSYSAVNRQFAAVDLQITLGGVAQNLFGEGTTYTYNHQRATWLRWQSAGMSWNTATEYIKSLITSGTFLAHDASAIFGGVVNESTNALPSEAAYKPFKVFSTINQDGYVGDGPRVSPGGGERTTIGPVHEWLARMVAEIGVKNNPSWLTPTRLQILQDLAETTAQFTIASGLLEPVSHRLLDPSVTPHSTHDNPNSWAPGVGIPQPGRLDENSSNPLDGGYDNAHPLNKVSFYAYHLSKDPFHLLQVQGQAIASLAYQNMYGNARGSDGKILRLASDQERGFWWGLQTLLHAWHATPSGTMPKPFRDKAWFAGAINNTLNWVRERFMQDFAAEPVAVEAAAKFWRIVSAMDYNGFGFFGSSRFQEDYGNIVAAQALLLGYSAARDVAEWRAGNIRLRVEMGGNWFLNDDQFVADTGQLAYRMAPTSGTLPYTNIAEFKAWYAQPNQYTSGPLNTSHWRAVGGRDTYLFLGALSAMAEAERRGLLTPGFSLADTQTQVRARLAGPYVTTDTGLPLNYVMYSKQIFDYQGIAIPSNMMSLDNYTGTSPMYFGRTA